MQHDTPLYARQPIFDDQLKLVAHELLFRGDFALTSGESATAEVLLAALDTSLFDPSSAKLPVFINFPAQILLDMPPLDHSRLVVEILEDVEVTPQLVESVKALREQGYRIALDDFDGCQSTAALLDHADIVKIDVLASAADLDALTTRLNRPGRALLAEKVEDHAMYERCRALGMDYYQGYFFARPNVVTGKVVNSKAATVLNLIAALQDANMTSARLEQIILGDTVLTYRILKLVNSARYRRMNEISSVAGAISLLGFRQVSSFASLLSLSNLDRRPRELGPYTALRAAFCQRLGAAIDSPFESESLFTLGVLSCCDAYFDQPMAELAFNLPVHTDLKAALISRSGTLGTLLNLAQRYQEGAWDSIDWQQAAALGLTREVADAAFLDSTDWVRENYSMLTD